jgi:endonuclease YncB( thermonuclease family)
MGYDEPPAEQATKIYEVQMRRIRIIAIIILLCFLSPAIAETLTGRVLRVIEGDRIVLLTPGGAQQQVRLLGIDAPERGQTDGARSQDYLAERLTGRFVVVVYQRRDRFGAIIGQVRLGGVDVNLEQIRAGMAWYYRHQATELTPSERIVYEQAEQEARREHRGLWAGESPVSPWEWRQAPPWRKQRRSDWAD